MGGVNFTRNRAWWHTAIWDEYNQRHQYAIVFPVMIWLIPAYWHGAFINRDLEQNFAAKMYQLEYEDKRLRMAHNLIMEHFEVHVEDVQDILDEIRDKGFEETFKTQLGRPMLGNFEEEKTGGDLTQLSREELAEWNEENEEHKRQNELINYSNYAIATREKVKESSPRRAYPGLPFRYLSNIPLSSSKESIEHCEFLPELRLRPFDLSIRDKNNISADGEEEEEE